MYGTPKGGYRDFPPSKGLGFRGIEGLYKDRDL